MKKNLKIKKIQKRLITKKIDCLVINRTDEFLNESISPDAERLWWASNFSGSAGRALITQNTASLFVDGRYTVQAKEQVDTDVISLFHLNDFWSELKKNFKKDKCVLLDPKLHSINEVIKIKKFANKNKTKLYFSEPNLVDEIWYTKPKRKYGIIFDHPTIYTGLDSSKKLELFIKKIKLNNLNGYFLSSLDSIAWLLNLRGFDVTHTPLVFAHILIPTRSKPVLYISISKINNDLRLRLDKILQLKPIEEIYNVFNNLDPNFKIGFDYNNSCYYFYHLALQNKGTPSSFEDPCLLPKASKNKTELKGSRKAHIRDGASVTKFIFWLKNHHNIEEENEISVANKLLYYRQKNKLFHSTSFESISAIGKNASLPHYRADEKNNIPMKNNCIYLSDSGGQYLDGTTDITRTIILGKSTCEQKDRFTRVLKGHINLSMHIFPKGTKGTDIDYLARQSLQEIKCDYDHGTGHGIGSFLSVHEGPQRISKKSINPSNELLPGMIISNEPGYYKEGEYGIRIENIIVVQEMQDGLLSFENISWAPIDRDLIKMDILNKKELKWINEYHQLVFEKLCHLLTSEEKLWLQKVTMPL